MARAKYTLSRVGATATPAQGITLANALRPFFMGAPGLGSGAAQISNDLGNMLIQGTDAKLMVPESFTVLARFSEISANPTAVIEARTNLGVEDIDCGTFN